MAYLLTLGDEIIYRIPDLTWQYLRAYWYPQYKEEKRIDQTECIHGDYYSNLIEGCQTGLDSERIKTLKNPPWLDEETLKKGQSFAKDYYSSICYSNLISLYLLFAHDRSLRPLIYTRRSNDIESAYKRYMSTIHRVNSWYEHDLTNPESAARKHIQNVNSYHLSVSSKLNSMSEDDFLNKSTLTEDTIEKDNDSYTRIQNSLKDSHIHLDCELSKVIDQSIHVSQCHMAVTQFGFMGLIILYPEKFGIQDKDDLVNFIHLWRYIGYLLGIEDKYNLCSGSVEEVFTKCRTVLECILKPSLYEVSSHWEHMSICVCQGINKGIKHLVFETTLAFLLDCIELTFDHFYKTMKLSSKLRYHLTKFIFNNVIPMNGMRALINQGLEAKLEKEKRFSSKTNP